MLWVKTFHILFVMSWMAGIFYLPRIFVHFVEGQAANEQVDRLSIPPIALRRLSTDASGRVVYRYRQPFRDGSTHVVLEPLDFLARLAALVPRPRLNLTRFHGVFAPNFKHRAKVVARHRQHRLDADKPRAPLSWMQRLKRVFAIDIETCPKCGGKLRVIACIEEPELIRKILQHVQACEEGTPPDVRGPPPRIPGALELA